jgi:hypothetical protein
MAWFKKKPDPISDRARALSDEIAALESQIKQLDSQLQDGPPQPRLRSTAMPQGATIQRSPEQTESASISKPEKPKTTEPIFEPVDQKRLKTGGEAPGTSKHYNELGVRKYDLPALLQRIKNHFHGPTTNNPKLVNYLAAGGVQGLRPLRYEKRVARNRLIALVIVLVAIGLGLVLVFVKHH